MRTIVFAVHGVSMNPVDVVLDHQGEPVKATIAEFEVELTAPAPHGTITLRYRKPSDVEWARSFFVPGQTVTWPLEGSSP